MSKSKPKSFVSNVLIIKSNHMFQLLIYNKLHIEDCSFTYVISCR